MSLRSIAKSIFERKKKSAIREAALHQELMQAFNEYFGDDWQDRLAISNEETAFGDATDYGTGDMSFEFIESALKNIVKLDGRWMRMK